MRLFFKNARFWATTVVYRCLLMFTCVFSYSCISWGRFWVVLMRNFLDSCHFGCSSTSDIIGQERCRSYSSTASTSVANTIGLSSIAVCLFFWGCFVHGLREGFGLLCCPICLPSVILGTFWTLFRALILGMGGDVWMRLLSPITPKGVNWMHLPNAAAALRYLHSLAGGPLTKVHHTQVARASRSNAMHDGWAFTLEKLLSVIIAVAAPSPSPSPSQLGATPQPLIQFFLPCVVLATAQTFVAPVKHKQGPAKNIPGFLENSKNAQGSLENVPKISSDLPITF